MAETMMRKTYKYKLKPTLTQERVLDGIVWACRRRYNTAVEQRIDPLHQRGVSLSAYTQMAELPDFRATVPEYAAVHSQVLQDVLARVERAYQAFFRRINAGKTPGFRAFRAARGSTVSPTKVRQRRATG